MSALSRIHEHIATSRDEIMRTETRGEIKTGPRRGIVKWSTEWWHGYHDALADLACRTSDAVQAEISPPRRYGIGATVTTQVTRKVARAGEITTVSRQVPTFYLLAAVQGIVSEDHARRVALDVIDPTGDLRRAGASIDITVCEA